MADGFGGSLDELHEAGTVDLPIAAEKLHEAEQLLKTASDQLSEALAGIGGFDVLTNVTEAPGNAMSAVVDVATNNARAIDLSAKALQVIEKRYRALEGID